MAKLKRKTIGQIGNYYGGLNVAQKDGKCYWFIENWDTAADSFDLRNAEEISKELYDQLIKHDRRVKRFAKKQGNQ